MRHALREHEIGAAFELAEHDSLSLAATTMTGPAGWVYWQPETLEVFETVQDLREEGVEAYYSTDTGASVYVNTTAEDVERVEAAIGELGVPTRVWEVGGPARIVDDALF
jgi:phosphomevalonate decarboxylase